MSPIFWQIIEIKVILSLKNSGLVYLLGVTPNLYARILSCVNKLNQFLKQFIKQIKNVFLFNRKFLKIFEVFIKKLLGESNKAKIKQYMRWYLYY